MDTCVLVLLLRIYSCFVASILSSKVCIISHLLILCKASSGLNFCSLKKNGFWAEEKESKLLKTEFTNRKCVAHTKSS